MARSDYVLEHAPCEVLINLVPQEGVYDGGTPPRDAAAVVGAPRSRVAAELEGRADGSESRQQPRASREHPSLRRPG